MKPVLLSMVLIILLLFRLFLLTMNTPDDFLHFTQNEVRISESVEEETRSKGVDKDLERDIVTERISGRNKQK